MRQRRTSLFLPPDVLDALDALKKRDGIPQAESVRRALYAYLKAKGMKLPSAGDQEPSPRPRRKGASR